LSSRFRILLLKLKNRICQVISSIRKSLFQMRTIKVNTVAMNHKVT
jgi:hypothetical protein